MPIFITKTLRCAKKVDTTFISPASEKIASQIWSENLTIIFAATGLDEINPDAINDFVAAIENDSVFVCIDSHRVSCFSSFGIFCERILSAGRGRRLECFELFF